MKHLILVIAILINVCSAYSDLRDIKSASDYLIIYHSEFKDEIQQFAEWRRTKGLKVLTVDLSTVYNEFSQIGQLDTSKSILEYTNFIIDHWKSPKLKYLLLVGSINHIPSNKIKSYFYGNPTFDEDSVNTDILFAALKDNAEKISNFAVGRFPARNVSELSSMIYKTFQYEDNYYQLDYKSDAVFLTDIEDSSIFNSIARDNMKLFANQERCKILNFTNEKPVSDFRNDMAKELSEGTAMFSYIGQGHPKRWSRSIIVDTDYLDTLHLSSKPFLFYSIACSQSFDDPEEKGIAEYLVSMEYQGAVATVASSGLTFGNTSTIIIKDILSGLIENDSHTIGNAMLYSAEKRDYDYWANLFNLLGDPALKVPFDVIASAYENEYSEKLSVYPNPANDFITIDLSAFTGDIDISVFDIRGSRLIQKSVYQSVPYTFNLNDLSAGNYFLVITSGDNTVVKSFIKY